MGGNNTSNTQALIRQQIWQNELEERLYEALLEVGIARELPFPDGKELVLPSISTPVVRSLEEDAEFIFDTIDSGEVRIRLNNPIYVANKMSRILREDSMYASEMMAALPADHVKAIMERYYTDLFALANRQALGTGNANVINGFAHRKIASGTGETMTPTDFSYANLALTKAKIPEAGRIAIVDPTVAYALENTSNIINVSNNPRYEGIITEGLMKNFKFVRNIFGFDVYSTNLLADANETVGGKTTTAGKANIFTSVANPRLLPFVTSWKSRPEMSVQEVFEKDKEWQIATRARYGTGVVRDENLVVIISDTDQVS
jgi:hypothetical protein